MEPKKNKPESKDIIKEVDTINDLNRIDIDIYNVIKSICKIITNTGCGTGFLLKLYKDNKEFLCLMTNEHVITKVMIENKEKIVIFYDAQNERKEIILNDRYMKEYTKLDLDITIIEIKKEDNIDKKYFLLPYIGELDLMNKNIFIVQFPHGALSYSKGKILNVNKFELTYDVKTQEGSSGSPIFLENTTKVIGIHKSGNKIMKENYGDSIYPFINDIEFKNFKQEEESYYEGLVINDKKYYQGKLYNDYGFIQYEGEFYNDKFEGSGKEYYYNTYYIGEFKNNLKHGIGILYYKNGKIKYKGDFVKGKLEGEGNYYFEDGESYIGKFINNKFHGFGVLYYKNGRKKYEGYFVNDKMEGNGLYYLENGSKYYLGQFKNDLKHGIGKLFYLNGRTLYEGDFIDDKITGKR